MCGIAGAIGAIDDAVVDAVRRMSDAQRHRGPDGSGLFVDRVERDGVVLAHRRLAIIDLSPDGSQPMTDPETGDVVVFNGEIYNFTDLRDELSAAGARFRSRSDTEVILKAHARWGADAVRRLRGMFAYAFWDRARRRLHLVRDRLGIKPLYLASVPRPGGRVLLFASEVRALLASGLVERAVDPVALASYVWNGFVVGPNTIVRDVELLPPATRAAATASGAIVERQTYWCLPSPSASHGTVDELQARLADAVCRHLVSDVPLGIFLSGGVDSSAIAALATRTSGSAGIRTFTISFDETPYDESRHAHEVARALGTEHHELRLTNGMFRAQLGDALASLDQPTFDGINTYFVSRAVREAGLTVALAGTGGDELFGGYRSFRDIPWAAAWSGRLAWLPPAMLRAMGDGAIRAATMSSPVPAQTRWGKIGDALAARGDVVSTYQVSHALFSSDFARALLQPGLNGEVSMGLPAPFARELHATVAVQSPLSAVATLEMRCFLGERLLRDTDSASMASSLEVRVPFVDHEVVSAACALAERDRFAPLGRKQIVRDAALRDLDPALFERPKSGFVLPIDRWARDAVKVEMTEAFSDRRFCEDAGLDVGAVNRLWTAFLAGARGIYWSRVWALYVLGWWCREHRMSVR